MATHNDELLCTFCRGKNDFCCNQKLARRLDKEKDVFDFASLPESILLKIFSFSKKRELFGLRSVCSQWRRVSEDRQLWRSLNMTCRRLHPSYWMFHLPEAIRNSVRVINLMWSCLGSQAFDCVKALFPNVEILLMQHCKFAAALFKPEGPWARPGIFLNIFARVDIFP